MSKGERKLKIDFKRLLNSYGVRLQDMNIMEYIHGIGDDEHQDVLARLKEKDLQVGGVYVYHDYKGYSNGKCLYVGKAKCLANRLRSHYVESFRPVPGDTKTQKWHRFFSSNRGTVVVSWIQCDEEASRQVLEIALNEVLNPAFNDFK